MGSNKSSSKAQSSPSPIGLTEAVKMAYSYFLELYPQFSNSNLLLEEVEDLDFGKKWSITLGYDVKRPVALLHPSIQNILSTPPPMIRKYKVLIIDAETGQVSSMKIRTLD